ncbi:glycosyltransferase [Marinobacter sp.]|uniref:glycosyltransferase n=1 Tax=Marinobacter sp. TaxID=50741 RepID=UPI003A900C3E
MRVKPINAPITVTHIISGDLWAGAEAQVYNLCQALIASKEVTVSAVIFNPGILHDKLLELGLPVTLANETNTGAFAIAKTIAAHCKAHGTDIVHTHGFKENVLGIMGKELARVRYSVRTVHGNPEQGFSFRKPHKWLTSRVDIWLGRFRQQIIIAVSTQLEERLKTLFPQKVHKIFNFVDVEDIRMHWPAVQHEAGLEPKLGIVGRLVPVKRVDLFIRTIALLNQQGFSCIGIIVGSGPLEAELKQLVGDLNISDRIEFKGFVDPAIDELRKLDMLLMTSDHEGLPMTLLEALALEVPVVAHSAGGIPEVLEEGKSGWLVSEHSEHGYASAIADVFQLSSGAKEKTKYGLLHVNRTFGLAKNSAQYIDLYKRLKSIDMHKPSNKDSENNIH